MLEQLCGFGASQVYVTVAMSEHDRAITASMAMSRRKQDLQAMAYVSVLSIVLVHSKIPVPGLVYSKLWVRQAVLLVLLVGYRST